MNAIARVTLAAFLCVGVAACAKKQEVKTPPPPESTGQQTTTTEGATMPGAYTPADLDTDACLRQRVVYFDFNQTEIKPEFQAQIACHAKYLRDRPMARMTLEGNADERGTREYNLGLGERRGNAVQSALEAAGASASQINVTSYGEERPTCREHSEDCWAKNRRVEIVYTAK